MPETIIAEIARIVGEKYVSTDIFEMINNSLDPLPYGLDLGKNQLPLAVVKPGNEEQVSRLFELGNEKDIPIYPRGSGTSFTGSARAPFRGIILSTSRLNTIFIDEFNGYFECGPGTTVHSVDAALVEKGYFLPVYPGSKLIASMGGMIAGNTSGHIIDACIGKPADYVLGLRVVLPTGEIIETGSKGLRKPAGTDLTKFFVGNDGLTGVTTKIRMRLVPAREKAYAIAYFNRPVSVANAVVRMYREKVSIPLFMEFMDRQTTEIGFQHAGLPTPPGCSIFFASVGSTQKIAQENNRMLLNVIKKENPISAQEIPDPREWEKIWTAREVIISSLMQRHDGHFCGPEIVSTLDRLPECITELEHYSEKEPPLKGLPFYLLGHIGALTFHPTVIVPRNWEDNKKRAIADAGFRIEKEMNLRFGTCGGEWLQFGKRTNFYKERYGSISYDIVHRIKKLFDPNDILNRGIMEQM